MDSRKKSLQSGPKSFNNRLLGETIKMLQFLDFDKETPNFDIFFQNARILLYNGSRTITVHIVPIHYEIVIFSVLLFAG